MTKKQAAQEFRAIFSNDYWLSFQTDKPGLREAWSNFTDSLCKDGRITARQYDTWTSPFDRTVKTRSRATR